MKKSEAIMQMIKGETMTCTDGKEKVSFNGKYFEVESEIQNYTETAAAEYIQFSPDEGWEKVMPKPKFKVGDFAAVAHRLSFFIVKITGIGRENGNYIYQITFNRPDKISMPYTCSEQELVEITQENLEKLFN